MSERIEITFEELHGINSEELVREAQAEETIRGGRYFAKLVKADTYRNGHDDLYDAGRGIINARLQLFKLDDPTQKAGQVFCKMSWERKVTASGRSDGKFRLYKDFLLAVATASDSPAEAIALGQQQFFMVDVQEKVIAPVEALHEDHLASAKGEGDTWVKITSDEHRDHYLGEGLEIRTMVDRIAKVR